MKCLNCLRSFLPVGGRPQWGLFLKACLVRLPILANRSMKWKWQENAETTSLPFSSRHHSTMVYLELSLVLLVACLLLSACSRSRSSHVSPPSTQAFHSSVRQTLQVKEKKSFYSDSSVFQLSKPLWSLQQDTLHFSRQP